MKLETSKESVNNDPPETEKTENEHVAPVVTDCVIEIKNEIQKKIDGSVQPQICRGGHSIFEVPRSLRKLQPDAFVPYVVSIGPYHRESLRFREMEEHKLRLLRHVLDRTKCPPNVLHSFTDAMCKLEEETRNCYDKHGFKAIKQQKFVEMMLLDSCFILEWLTVAAYGILPCGYKADDPLFTSWGISRFIRRDLLLLQNQLPLFVLDELFRLTRGGQSKKEGESVEQLALKFFDAVLPELSQNSPEDNKDEPPRPRLHLLDVVRHALRPCPSSPESREIEQPRRFPFFNKLRRALCPSSICMSSQANCDQEKQANSEDKESPLPLDVDQSLRPSSPESREKEQSPFPFFNNLRQNLCPSSRCIMSSQANCDQEKQANSEDKKSPLHLDVDQSLRPHLTCRSSKVKGKQPFRTGMHSVTSLRRTSVDFKIQDSTKFTDIVFDLGKGVLYVPRLIIHDSTKSIFLNLMVFEQYYPRCSNYVTSYVTFMDGLINSAKDVEYLYEKGIIEHDLGSDEDVACLFNSLRKEIVSHTNDYYLAKVSHDLNKHFNKKWHTRKATLKHEYLKDPWKVISLVAATFLIFFTLAQTTYTVLGYHRPPS